jgi:lipoprotein-anchoring transpeptidase ErfK/SrfK
MNAQIKKFFLAVLIPAVLFVPDGSARAQAAKHRTVHRRVVVSLPDRRLALVENGKVKKVYVVAVGKRSTPSPTGTFTIMNRVTNPMYAHDGEVMAPGPGNPVGTRWMGLSAKGYGIHGTNRPRSIGKAASHGCIRMRKDDLEELFDTVETGDEVEIIGERDAETAEIFGVGQRGEASAGAVEVTADATVPAGALGTPAGAVAAAMPVAR